MAIPAAVFFPRDWASPSSDPLCWTSLSCCTPPSTVFPLASSRDQLLTVPEHWSVRPSPALGPPLALGSGRRLSSAVSSCSFLSLTKPLITSSPCSLPSITSSSSAAAGWAFNLINRQLCFVASIAASGLALLTIPFVHDLYFFVVSQAVLGFFTAGMDVAGNAWILEIWQEVANPYMQGMHFCYAVGMTIAPLIAEPFLSPDIVRENRSVIAVDNGTAVAFFNLTKADAVADAISRQSHIAVPYSICAVTLFAAAALLFTLYVKTPYLHPTRTVSQAKASARGLVSAANDENVNLIALETPRNYYVSVILLGSALLCFYSGIEMNTFTFLPDFVVYVDLHLSKAKAAFMTSLLSAAFACSRGISIFVATRFKPMNMLYTNLVLIGVGNGLMLTFANSSEHMLWLSLVIMGFGYSCVFPGIYSFLEERINVTNTLCGLFMFASSIATTINPIILGYYIETNPLIFVYINLISLVTCLAVFVGLHSTDSLLRKQELTILS